MTHGQKLQFRELAWWLLGVPLLVGCGTTASRSEQDGAGGAEGGNGGSAGSGAAAGVGGMSGDGSGICEGDRTVRTVSELEKLREEGCREITGYLSIQAANDEPSIISLIDLAELESVGGIGISNQPALTSLEGLESLTVVAEDFVVENNPRLASLRGLENVKHAGAYFGLYENPALTSLDPLHDWPEDALTDEIEITGNAVLRQCEIEAFDAEQKWASCENGPQNDCEQCSYCTGNGGEGACRGVDELSTFLELVAPLL